MPLANDHCGTPRAPGGLGRTRGHWDIHFPGNGQPRGRTVWRKFGKIVERKPPPPSVDLRQVWGLPAHLATRIFTAHPSCKPSACQRIVRQVERQLCNCRCRRRVGAANSPSRFPRKSVTSKAIVFSSLPTPGHVHPSTPKYTRPACRSAMYTPQNPGKSRAKTHCGVHGWAWVYLLSRVDLRFFDSQRKPIGRLNPQQFRKVGSIDFPPVEHGCSNAVPPEHVGHALGRPLAETRLVKLPRRLQDFLGLGHIQRSTASRSVSATAFHRGRGWHRHGRRRSWPSRGLAATSAALGHHAIQSTMPGPRGVAIARNLARSSSGKRRFGCGSSSQVGPCSSAIAWSASRSRCQPSGSASIRRRGFSEPGGNGTSSRG